jgi:predicted membrane channel-forming protein YqfA (hemolysin III family)
MATEPTGGEAIQYRSAADERANSLTHGTGILLSLAGAVVIIPATHSSNLGVPAVSCRLYRIARRGLRILDLVPCGPIEGE